MYDYKHKYLFQANVRRDASSRFHKDYRWGTFPSVSAGWVITEEPWMAKAKPYLSFLKLRASYGTLGNERIGTYPYQAIMNLGEVLMDSNKGVVSQMTAAQKSYNINDIVSAGKEYLSMSPLFDPYNPDGSYRLYYKVWDQSLQDWSQTL